MTLEPEACDEPVALSVAVLSGMASPFREVCWPGLSRPVSVRDIERAIATGRLVAPEDRVNEIASRMAHVSRIAWFAVHGWEIPISVDIGVPGFPGYRPFWPIQDGNHRFAAAVYRGDKTILAEFGGSINEATRLGLFADIARSDGVVVLSRHRSVVIDG